MNDQLCLFFVIVATITPMAVSNILNAHGYKLNNEVEILIGTVTTNKNLKHLDLSNSTSFELPRDRAVFSHKELKWFYCNNCSIHSVYRQSFALIPKLAYLELNHNNLSYIDADAFENNQLLHKVTLIGNNLVKFNPEAALRHVTQLSCLIMDQNVGFDINEVTIELPWLTYFSCKYCNTSLIEKPTMHRWKRIVNLRLPYNRIDKITEDAFEDLTRFKYLNVDGNRELKELTFESKTLLHLSAANCGLEGKLNTSSLEALESIDVRSNKISHVVEHGFYNNKKIKKILLDDNDIEKIPEKLLELPLYELESLCIDENPLQPRELLRNFTLKYSSRKLRRGCMDDGNPTNQFELILPCQTGKALYRELDELDITEGFTFKQTSGDIVYIESTFFNNFNITNVILDENKRLSFPISHVFLQSESITNLSLAHCAIKDVYVETFQQLQNIKFISMRGNKIQTLNTHLIFQNNTLLEELDLSENQLTFIVSNLFQDLKFFRTLNLQQNRLYSIVPGNPFLVSQSVEFFDCHQCNFSQIDNISLSGLPNLKSLNLSQSSIEFIDEYALSWRKDLQTLDLSDNNLTNFKQDFGKLNNLETLCLSGNNQLLSSNSNNITLNETGNSAEELEMGCREKYFLEKILPKKKHEQNVTDESMQQAYKQFVTESNMNESFTSTEKSSNAGTLERSLHILFGVFIIQVVILL